MAQFLSWRIVPRRDSPAPATQLPAGFRTLASPFRHDGLPDEVALLLPNQDGARSLLNAVAAAPEPSQDEGLGLFLADPFLNIPQVCRRLNAAGITWVANLPSVTQQDEEFARQLTDVGLDLGRELSRLAALRDEGFRIAVTVTDRSGAASAVEIAPDVMIVLPRIADFAAGFPSARQRGAAVQEVAAAAAAGGWSGSLLGLGSSEEAAYERLWPGGVDGLLCRPVLA
jgi:hypothetical protein